MSHVVHLPTVATSSSVHMEHVPARAPEGFKGCLLWINKVTAESQGQKTVHILP